MQIWAQFIAPSRADVFGALANPSRHTILDCLLRRPLTAGELTGRLDLSRSSASEHLSVLKEAGLVREERHGRHRMYHLQAERLKEVSTWLKDYAHYWNQRLDALADLLDGQSAEPENPHGDLPSAGPPARIYTRESQDAGPLKFRGRRTKADWPKVPQRIATSTVLL
ncbi:ArsR/SmtB family transcription factor [Paenarthrobacter aurescens]|uniref:Transcriptional regulator, ArsR family n=1 Tax=Paenarthrobacter aurescens (strain TC1) TaxID=290340 RepID=A1R3Y1_PAEAT|nr:metalloregulator ArsR/SmtB family transcription factor [Paenarthrobacter aurescens]ABM08766.1 putative transcriptional regulator, ArsR family [Paenarthrobacter aurescens TC1]